MHKRIAMETMRIAALHLPGDMHHRVDTQRVELLAESIARHGLLQPPTIRMPHRTVIAGRDRLAACMKLGRIDVEVITVQCTDRVADILERIEDAHRRHDQEEKAQKTLELVNLYEVEERERESDERAIDQGPGRPKGARGRARDRVAWLRGIQPDSVRKAEQRAKRKGPPEKSCINDLGIEIDVSILNTSQAIQKHLDICLNHVRQAKIELTKLEHSKLGLGPLELPHYQQLLDDTSAGLRNERPDSLCPYCKGIGGYQQRCTPCNGGGWVGRMRMENVPDQLLSEEPVVVMSNGRLEEVEFEPEEEEVEEGEGDGNG